MSITITAERADTPDAAQLVNELDGILRPKYSPESCHGYTVEQLVQQDVAFFVLRVNGEPAGCGGVQFYGTDYAELKRMYVRPAFRGQGLSKRMLTHLADYSAEQGYTVLRLETGIYQEAAISLYERTGFYKVPPFGDYQDDPMSLFYEKKL
jgi:putative acetyltransferase